MKQKVSGGIGHEGSEAHVSQMYIESRRPSELNSGFLGSRSGGSASETAMAAEVGSFHQQHGDRADQPRGTVFIGST